MFYVRLELVSMEDRFFIALYNREHFVDAFALFQKKIYGKIKSPFN